MARMILLLLMVIMLQRVGFSCDLDSEGVAGLPPQRMNTVSMAIVGGFPIPVYGLSLLVPADSTEEPCWIITLSGYKDMWAGPPIVMSGGMGYNIRLDPILSIRPAISIGDFGLSPQAGESYIVFTVHLGLWIEGRVSRRVTIVANLEKRFDITYRYYSPWGLGVGIRVDLER